MMRYYTPSRTDDSAARDAIAAHHAGKIQLAGEEFAACLHVRASYAKGNDVTQDVINRCHDAVVKFRDAQP